MTRVAESVLPPGVIEIINGDVGSITGHTVTIYTNHSDVLNNSGATVLFTNSGTVSTLSLTDSNNNTFIGLSAGGSGATAGLHNIGLGYFSLYSSGSNCRFNTAIGNDTLANMTLGSYNTCLGWNAGTGATTLTGNTLVGAEAGSNGLGSNNIILGANVGVPSESNTMRLGNVGSGATAITSTYIQGITGVTTANSQFVTINSSTGQLGVATGPVATWTDVTGATQQLAVANGYITDRGGGVTYTLPATAALGDVIEIVGKSGIATITPNANQQIIISTVSGTVGVTGTAVGQNAASSIVLKCITAGASTVWRGLVTSDNWTLT